MARPAYDIDAEARAYDAGFRDGSEGRAIAYTQLALTFPNAYHRGYWDGVGDHPSEYTNSRTN